VVVSCRQGFTCGPGVIFLFSQFRNNIPMISLDQAHQHIGRLCALNPHEVSLDEVLGLVCAEDVHGAVDCPSVDSSLKDGFAVISTDIGEASPETPVTLKVVGSLAAGQDSGHFKLERKTAVRIMTGAAIPPGATAVLASEFSRVDGDRVTARADARPGRNILRRGSDILKDQLVLVKGTRIRPAHLGLLAAAGSSQAHGL
jgi:molybdopterin molybdotransferase